MDEPSGVCMVDWSMERARDGGDRPGRKLHAQPSYQSRE